MGAAQALVAQDALFPVQPLHWGYCPPPFSTAHPLPCPGHFGLASGALVGATGASTARDGILSKLIEVNSRIMLVGFVLWPPKERRL